MSRNEASAEWKRGDPIEYVRDEIPEFDVPLYEGERYQAPVPDTLDMQGMAALAVNGLTGPMDPEADYELYIFAHLNRNPPMMDHDWSDQCQSKFMESLPLMRVMSGSGLNDAVDRRWMDVLLQTQGADGMLYWSTGGRP